MIPSQDMQAIIRIPDNVLMGSNKVKSRVVIIRYNSKYTKVALQIRKVEFPNQFLHLRLYSFFPLV